MSEDRTHDDIRALLSAVALDLLEQEELRQVLEHANACPACLQQLAEYQEVVASLTLRLPARPMDAAQAAGMRDRLLSRARGSARGSAALLQMGRGRSTGRMPRWSGWAALAAGLTGVLLVHHSVHRPLDYGWLVAGVLLVGLVLLAVYARKQAARHSALQERLTRLERKSVAEPGERDGPRPS